MAITFDLTKEFDPGLDAEETIFDKLPSTKESQLAMMQAGIRPDEPTKSYIPSKRSAFSEPSSLTDSPDVIVDSEKLGTGNPLDDLQAPAPQPSQKEKASEETMGRIISRGFGYIEKLKDMKGARFGQKREVAVMKAMDEAAIARTYNIMQDHLRRNGYDDPNLLEDLAKHRGGGYRSAENIDRLFEIKSKGTKFQDENGEVILAPDSEWEKIFEADRISRAMSLKSQKTATGGGAEEISRWQNVLESTLDADGNVMPNRIGEYEKATSELDRLSGAPTGVSKFASQYNSKQDRISKMTAAFDSGIPYKGLAAEQIPSEILKLNQETVELAVENAPYFGSNDREAAAKWITDPATKGLPFRSDYEGKKIPHFVTSEPGVYNIWSPKEKTWMVVDKRKPKPETAAAPETDNSQFSEAGKTGQKIRRAAGKLSGVAESGLVKAGVAVADLLPLSVNTGAAVIEGAAGVFDSPLKLDRMDYMEERAKKNKVGKYRVK